MAICQNEICQKFFRPRYGSIYCCLKCANEQKGRTKAKHQKAEYEKKPLRCKQCRAIIPYENRLNNVFCSRSCSASHNNPTRKRNIILFTAVKFINCKYCDKLIAQPSNRYRRICSDKCKQVSTQKRLDRYYSDPEAQRKASETARKNLPKIQKRSKLEKELFELCETLHTNVVPNLQLIDGWDADIVFPEQKIAVFWNGAWHYREINGLKHSLKQVRNRDLYKRKLFRENGWKVLVFEDRYWMPSTAFEAIKNLIIQ